METINASLDARATETEAPASPVSAPAVPSGTARPRNLNVALALLSAWVAVELLSLATNDEVLKGHPGIIGFATVVVTLTMLAVYSGLLIQVGRRRNWARILCALFAALATCGFAVTVFAYPIEWSGRFAIACVQFALQLAANVLLFLPASNAWFRSRRVGP